ncbi:hypothetical protein KR059_012638 [Drosophila kikkawai]|nr:hypothetical protein KR059_012638 [Drosophila kikkawai]
MLLISTLKATLLALVIVTWIGPSAAPLQNDGDDEASDFDGPWECKDQSEFQESEEADALDDFDLSQSEDYYSQLEDFQNEPKMSSDQMLKNNYANMANEEFQELPDALDYMSPIDKAKENPANELDFKRMIHLPWGKDRKAKSHSFKEQFCRITPSPSRRPGCQGSTSLPRSSSSCPPKMTTPPPPPPPPPPTAKPPPCKAPSSKCRQKPKSRTLTPKTAEMLLAIIMDTKQHVLFVLEILSHMENEVLTRAPDNCQRHDLNLKAAVPDKRPSLKKKPEKLRKFPYGDYRRKSPSFREGKLRQKEHRNTIDLEDNYLPPSLNQAANRMDNLLESALQPMGLNKNSYKKYRNHGQKKQSLMKKIPPGMVSILA